MSGATFGRGSQMRAISWKAMTQILSDVAEELREARLELAKTVE
jgi:hypothetical protein